MPRRRSNGGSSVLHSNAVRIRVVGSGNLDLEFRGYDNVLTQTLTPVAMTTVASRERNVLANFQSQAIKLKGSTDEINEVMRINSIVIFVKEMWTDYPG